MTEYSVWRSACSCMRSIPSPKSKTQKKSLGSVGGQPHSNFRSENYLYSLTSTIPPHTHTHTPFPRKTPVEWELSTQSTKNNFVTKIRYLQLFLTSSSQKISRGGSYQHSPHQRKNLCLSMHHLSEETTKYKNGPFGVGFGCR